MEWGATPGADGVTFAVRSTDASRVWLCLFDGEEERRLDMTADGDRHWLSCPDVRAGQRYGLRAEGPWDPDKALLFDPAKLLVDPYATRLDGPFAYDPRMARHGLETAALVPKAIVTAPLPPVPRRPPMFDPGGLIYEVNVRGFTQLHPDVPAGQRGTLAALRHPAVIDHLRGLRVSAVELMPVVAWIDERSLHALGLANAWGYNPVVPMAIDPRLAPGGVADLRETVDALHSAGIGVILDLVFNHSGESDLLGPTLSLRGLDNAASYAHGHGGVLVNYAGTGNMFDFAQDGVRDLCLASLRHFVGQAGVDGFRFDLAPILARHPDFDPRAPIFDAIANDPLLADRVMIAEPWDIGPGGYQLGQFPPSWHEWNDRYRDDVRRFWRGDGRAADLATRMCGSRDIFGEGPSRSISYLASHDGFPVADVPVYAGRHNEANGEHNHDGQADNSSWNCGVEGPTGDSVIVARRGADTRAMLATLFASRGAIMLTAGDEFGRTQGGNNNAYAQDNAISWLDWAGRDRALEHFVRSLADQRAAMPELAAPNLPDGVTWRALDGQPLSGEQWADPALDGFVLSIPGQTGGRVEVRIDRTARLCTVQRVSPASPS